MKEPATVDPERSREALRMLRESMSCRLKESQGRLVFVAGFDDLIWWASVIAFGLGELKTLDASHAPEPAVPLAATLEGLHAQADLLSAMAEQWAAGSLSLEELVQAVAMLDHRRDQVCARLLGDGRLHEWVGVHRYLNAVKAELWKRLHVVLSERDAGGHDVACPSRQSPTDSNTRRNTASSPFIDG